MSENDQVDCLQEGNLRLREQLRLLRQENHRLNRLHPDADGVVPILGGLAPIERRGETLRIEGCALPAGGGTIDGFRVWMGGRKRENFDLSLNLPSPRFSKTHAGLEGATRARFNLRVLLNAEEHLDEELVVLTPLVGDYEGQMLLGIVGRGLPLPEERLMRRVGAADAASYQSSALAFLGIFIQRVGLEPSHQVLDVGCGVGRMAFGLGHFLSPVGRYEGFDVIEELVECARTTIGERRPNFTFQHVDLFSKNYNPKGNLQASEFSFPYGDGAFDLVLLTSVFTHIFAGDVRHYLEEIHRVLAAGGRCLATYFLLNAESRRLTSGGESSLEIVHELEDCFTANPDVPEAAIGFEEEKMLGWIEEHGLKVRSKYYGSWCGRKDFLSFQDILVLECQSPTGEDTGRLGVG